MGGSFFGLRGRVGRMVVEVGRKSVKSVVKYAKSVVLRKSWSYSGAGGEVGRMVVEVGCKSVKSVVKYAKLVVLRISRSCSDFIHNSLDCLFLKQEVGPIK